MTSVEARHETIVFILISMTCLDAYQFDFLDHRHAFNGTPTNSFEPLRST